MKDVNESLGEVSKPRKVERDIAVRTGIPSLDSALGGGLPSGLVEIFGGMSVGKTAMSAAIIGQAQRDGVEVAYAPTESQEGPYLERCGVKLSSLAVIRGRSPEALEECFVDWFQSGRRRLLVLDSINAARPYDQCQFDWNEWAYNFLLKMKDVVPVRSAVITTGQARFKRSADGKFEGLEESASRRVTDLFDVRIELVRDEVGEDAYTMLVNVVANILRQPGLYVDLHVEKGYGIDVERDMVKAALALGIVERFGSSYHVDGTYVARGMEEMKKRLRREPKMKKFILDAALSKWAV
jgi:recombination protein RecA